MGIILPETHHSAPIRRTSDEPKFRDILKNACPVLLKTVKVMKIRNCHRAEDPREHNNESNVGFRMGPWNREKRLWENVFEFMF